MARPASTAGISYAEYLTAESASETRHEFLNGEVWAMAGGTPEHSALAAAMIRELGVLSDSTEGYDRGTKAAHYRRIPSVQAYVLVSQREPLIELYRRRDDRWELIEARPGEFLDLPVLDVRLDVQAIYANPFEAQSTV